MSPRQVALLADNSTETLEGWRGIRKGPRDFKVGGSVRYKLQDIGGYIEAGRPVT